LLKLQRISRTIFSSFLLSIPPSIFKSSLISFIIFLSV
jgi:AAA+ ATPase superfamily predicted ATPase